MVSLFFTSLDYLDAWIYIPVLTLGVFFLVCQDWRGVLFPLSGKADIFSIQVFMEVYLPSFLIFVNTVVGHLGAVLSVVLSFMVMSVSRVAYSWTYVKLTHIPRLLLMLLLTCIYIVSACLTGSANSLVAVFITIGLLLLLNCDLLHLLKRKIIRRYIMK